MTEDFIPFNSIGLCFSGGGYRATFYSLGVVSYLHRIQYMNESLLTKVEAISTVSGGTLLGVAYAKAAQSEDFDFPKFYKEFYEAFEPDNDVLLETAISKLEDDVVWKAHPHKKRSLINAFALTYASMPLFEGDFKIFDNPEHTNLKHVCFNATDFSFGLAFRFQNTGRFGNKPLNNTQINQLKYHIPLGDIIASSSCFPLGFEPLVFPDDYFKDHKSPSYRALKSLDRFIDGVGIMDGGIADNQGIGSMINISRQSKMKGRLNLIIVNDVGSFKMDPWKPDTTGLQPKKTLKNAVLSFLSHFGVKPLYWIILLTGVLLLVLNSMGIIKNQVWPALYIVGSIITGIGLTLLIFGLIASVVKTFGVGWLRSLFKKNVPEVLLDDVLTFQKLDIGLIKRMLTDRITSGIKMINDIFLKQIRRLNYDLLYQTKELQNKIITSRVYELNGQSTPYHDFKVNEAIKPAPSTLLKNVGLTASETPTTLWWDQTDRSVDRMDTLIACGQFTTCYNLMDYILKLKKENITTDEIEAMYELLETDWKAFNKDPFMMFH
ncbi:patatin-like phospholipase family protein [Flavobacteriaceae bacterium TP-CH-4]|uniref:Patatin-like phospholipase family protein n=1 Tax=Pelagihabitans pacificus TaxID=2696054 RepID=A0A967E770_9FLAO|nr:patatin-like phospholipase family protein [Pelagihabitans pacificus]NHF59929.1 patatin-like phospholipase family protein [Pelagihabitans pacificus]